MVEQAKDTEEREHYSFNINIRVELKRHAENAAAAGCQPSRSQNRGATDREGYGDETIGWENQQKAHANSHGHWSRVNEGRTFRLKDANGFPSAYVYVHKTRRCEAVI
jgi:hypothetical protein